MEIRPQSNTGDLTTAAVSLHSRLYSVLKLALTFNLSIVYCACDAHASKSFEWVIVVWEQLEIRSKGSKCSRQLNICASAFGREKRALRGRRDSRIGLTTTHCASRQRKKPNAKASGKPSVHPVAEVPKSKLAVCRCRQRPVSCCEDLSLVASVCGFSTFGLMAKIRLCSRASQRRNRTRC
jgi:hypothetical protein